MRGVRLADGDGLDADAVVTTVSARPLARLLPDGALPKRPMNRLRSWRYGVGTFKADFALDGPVPWANADARQAGVVQLGDTLEAAFRSQQQAGLGRVPDEPVLVIAQHSLHDESRAPAAKHTYVAGASTHPGPGVHGVSGRGAADALLADLSPLRFWR